MGWMRGGMRQPQTLGVEVQTFRHGKFELIARGAIDRDRHGPGWEAGLTNGWSAVPSTESTKIYVLEIDRVRLTKSRSDILGILLNLHQRA